MRFELLVATPVLYRAGSDTDEKICPLQYDPAAAGVDPKL